MCFCGRAMLLGRQCCLEWKILWRLSKLSVSFLSSLLGFSRSMGGFFFAVNFIYKWLFIWAIITGATLPCGELGLKYCLDVLNALHKDCRSEAHATNMWAGGKHCVYVIHALVSTSLYIKEMRKKKKKVPLWKLEQQKLFYYSFMPLLLSSTACFALREYGVLSGWLCCGHTKVCEQYDIPYHFECACFADRVHCYMMYALCVSFTVHFGRRVFHLKTAMLADLAVQLVCVRV